MLNELNNKIETQCTEDMFTINNPKCNNEIINRSYFYLQEEGSHQNISNFFLEENEL